MGELLSMGKPLRYGHQDIRGEQIMGWRIGILFAAIEGRAMAGLDAGRYICRESFAPFSDKV